MHTDDQMWEAMAKASLSWVGAVTAKRLEGVSRERRHHGCSRMRLSYPVSNSLEYLACLVSKEGKWSSVGSLRYSLISSWASHRRAVPLTSAIERQHKQNSERVNGIAPCVFHYVRGRGAVWWHCARDTQNVIHVVLLLDVPVREIVR
jgi:hypothetical protein